MLIGWRALDCLACKCRQRDLLSICLLFYHRIGRRQRQLPNGGIAGHALQRQEISGRHPIQVTSSTQHGHIYLRIDQL